MESRSKPIRSLSLGLKSVLMTWRKLKQRVTSKYSGEVDLDGRNRTSTTLFINLEFRTHFRFQTLLIFNFANYLSDHPQTSPFFVNQHKRKRLSILEYICGKKGLNPDSTRAPLGRFFATVFGETWTALRRHQTQL